MDFNPLDILAAAALGEKDAPPEIKNPQTDQSKSSGQSKLTPFSEVECAKKADNETEPEMGKSGSNCLKRKENRETISEKAMAPQKTPWSPDSLLQLSPDKPVQTDGLSLDDIVKDIKSKGLDMELTKIIGKSFVNDDCLNHDHVINFRNGQNNNLVTVKNQINSSLNEELSKTKLLTDAQSGITNSEQETSVISDAKSIDSGVSGGDSSPDSDFVQFDPWTLDHPYALTQGQGGPHPSIDNDDIDVCSDLSPLSEGSDQRPGNINFDCNYLKSGALESVSASALDEDLYGIACSPPGRCKLPSSSSSTSSPNTDLGSRSSRLLDNSDHFTEPTASKSPSQVSVSPNKSNAKFGKFKIGTFASFSSSNLELEKYLRNHDPVNHKKLNIGIPSEPHAVGSILNSSSVQPLLQSPTLDWDRSEAGLETQDDSSDAKTPHRLSPDFTTEKVTEWSHPMYHDHDYCAKDGQCGKPENFKKLSTAKRKYTKRKSKLDLINHEKIMKAKYLKKELLKQDSFLKSPVESEPVMQEDNLKANPVGRPRKKTLEKVLDEEIDPETGTKLKITGKFQDQYVYYLSKSSRTTTRRRQAPSLPIFPDKIIVPPPKPGDIVVHHLTDSDIETVRLKGRGALNLPERPNNTNPHSTSTVSSLSNPCPPCPSQSNDTISDVDIVSTILSMENDNLSSPTTTHASPTDLSSTAGINPHQPVLTESLRMASGESNITSEHVLNYLLSVVKDEQLLGNGTGFETSTSALFPSIPPDAIYSKAENGELGLIDTPASLSSGTFGNDSSNRNSFSESISSVTSSHIQGPYQFAHNCARNGVDDSVDLPDDFSSLMPNSQESSANCNQHNLVSQNPLKFPFGSDISSLGTPHLSTAVPRLTSIEKTLDYLGVKDGDIKLDGNGYSASYVDTCPIKDENQLAYLPDHQADETPWIVTVTLYFNDVPAIMVNSEPFIRLVDIHKQILPAKDTGILKKRCQLLNIPVLNCNEMQRYFLVQYGRAYNSKSTLIISKDQATKLVTYYAMPQPRTGKVEDTQNRRPSSCGSDSGTRSPITCPPSGVNQKGLHKSAKKSVGLLDGSLSGVGETFLNGQAVVVSQTESEAGQNKRTRHKKVNYLEMLKGEEKVPSEDSILETIEAVVRSAPDYVKSEKDGSKKMKSKTSRRDYEAPEMKSKGSKKNKSLTKSKKHDKKSRKHGHKERHRSSKKHSSKSLSTDRPLVKHSALTYNFDPEAYIDHSQNKRFKPLKLKVHSLLNFAGHKRSTSSSPSSASPSPSKKAGLFSRSNSGVSPSSPVTTSLTPNASESPQISAALQQGPPKVLAVAHQAASAQSSGESRLPSQPADIHLDLFTRPSSACVQCRTCKQFLSVPHFMRHHHVPMDNQWLASEAAHRILVPLARSDNSGLVRMSERERLLWEEFHRLQEAIGGFGEGDDESDSEVDYDEDDKDVDEDEEVQNDKVTPGDQRHSELLRTAFEPESSAASSSEKSRIKDMNVINKNTKNSSLAERSAFAPTSNSTGSNSVKLTTLNKSMQRSEASISKAGLVKRDSGEIFRMSAFAGARVHSESLVRHSSRKRKSKQFFSIENYDTAPKKALEDNQVNSSAPYG
ncbi:hypothetical protein PoB_007689300 [Plakobranchus ocellatus]|uniref:Putative Dachshund-homology domain-containing protein n=1 Tax=Plakobranchus ocellatus TaxID=259542 RepID=A0AAV4E1F3_9GAST|nr:hypothetical protein PoB_007689300 [Plakobranchus ocellatus]